MEAEENLAMGTLVSAAADQVSCEMDEEMVILSLRTGAYYGLNPVAAAVWDLLQEQRTVGQIVEALTDEFAIAKERCAAEVSSLLAELIDLGLVRVHSD